MMGPSTNFVSCGMHPRGCVTLIAVTDIIISLVWFFLSSLAIADLHKISSYIERDISDSRSPVNEYPIHAGINEFTHKHAQAVLMLLSSLVSLMIAGGLFFGIRKDWDCPIKAWLINGLVLILLGVISILVLTIVTNQLAYLFLFSILFVRLYELWIVFDFLHYARFTSPVSQTGSAERLHSV